MSETEKLILCPQFSVIQNEQGQDEITLANFPQHPFYISSCEFEEDVLQTELIFVKENVDESQRECFREEVTNLILSSIEHLQRQTQEQEEGVS